MLLPLFNNRAAACSENTYDALSEQVHIWQLSVATLHPDRIESFRRYIDDQESERISRLATSDLQLEALASRGGLREILSTYLNTDPGRIRFNYGQFGKFCIASPTQSGIEFSVSHSTGHVAYAFTRNRKVGIDVECINPSMITDDLLPQVFTEDERRELLELPKHLREKAFFALWTRKEAYIKGTGEGFSADLHSFSITVDHGEARFLRGGEGWHIHSLELFSKCESALAVSGTGYTVRTCN